jgi:hypothetical protein
MATDYYGTNTHELLILHHTATRADITPRELSDIGRARVYGGQRSYHYGTPGVEGESFVTYHALVYPDGRLVSLLDDGYIAWHAGNWARNTQSLALAFAGDYSRVAPSAAALDAAAGWCAAKCQQYAIPPAPERILGHGERATEGSATACPGGWWQQDGQPTPAKDGFVQQVRALVAGMQPTQPDPLDGLPAETLARLVAKFGMHGVPAQDPEGQYTGIFRRWVAAELAGESRGPALTYEWALPERPGHIYQTLTAAIADYHTDEQTVYFAELFLDKELTRLALGS